MTSKILFISDSHLFHHRNELLFGTNPFEGLQIVTGSLSRNEKPFDLLVAMGDLSHDGSAESYRDFQALTENIANEVIWVAGNHDDFSGLDPAMTPYLKDTWNRENWHFLFLDSSQKESGEGFLDADELEKLKAFLENHKEEYLIICLHHQPEAVGSKFIDDLGLRNKNEFWALLEGRTEVKAVLFGHVHQEVDNMVQGIRLLSVPATSVPFKPGSDEFAIDRPKRGYRTASLQPDGTFRTATVMIPGDR